MDSKHDRLQPVHWHSCCYACRNFNFDIVHRLGIEHQTVDTLSCLHTSETDEWPVEDNVPILTVTNARYGNGMTKTDNYDQFDQIWIYKTDKLRLRMLEALHIADVTDSEKPLTSGGFHDNTGNIPILQGNFERCGKTGIRRYLRPQWNSNQTV